MRVLLYPDPRLRRRAEKIPSSAFGTPGIRNLAQALANCLAALEREMGDVLACTQVEIDPPWRVLALRTPRGIAVMCNPEITSHENEVVEFEMSFSFLSTPVQLLAPRKLTVQYRTPEGERREVECDPTGARAVWQGCESLEGKLVIDRLAPLQKLVFASKYRRALDEKVVPVGAS